MNLCESFIQNRLLYLFSIVIVSLNHLSYSRIKKLLCFLHFNLYWTIHIQPSVTDAETRQPSLTVCGGVGDQQTLMAGHGAGNNNATQASLNNQTRINLLDNPRKQNINARSKATSSTKVR